MTTFIWLMIRTGRRLLWTWQWTFGFHKMRGIPLPATVLFIFSRGTGALSVCSVNVRLQALHVATADLIKFRINTERSWKRKWAAPRNS
jgi:hypothetical protein